jgi:hypothetical protein
MGRIELTQKYKLTLRNGVWGIQYNKEIFEESKLICPFKVVCCIELGVYSI